MKLSLTALPAWLRSRRIAVWLALVVAATVAVARNPLGGVLGYELALTMAALGSVVGVDLGAAGIRRRRRAGAEVGCARALAEAATPPVLIMTAPLVMIATRGLWVRTCDPWFGVEAYLALTVASTALAAVASAAIAIAVGPRRWLGPAAPYLALLIVIAFGVHRFISEPPVFTYSPLVGFFPGNLYDEDIRLEAPLAWARLEQLVAVLALAALVAARYDRARLAVRWRGGGLARTPAVIAAVAVLAAGGLRSQAGRLGYAIDRADIAAALGGTVRTEHFIIHYDDTPEIRADIALIAADHEFRLAQVCAAIGVRPEEVGTIRSFYFATADRKARLMGARHVEMAKPWLRQIYLTHEGFPHPSLRHEIAHVVAGTFGDPWFGVAARRVAGLPVLVNPGLIEGLAVALDWPGASRSMTPHQAMRAMQELGYAPSADDVFSVRFMTLSSARGYTAAGSFLRFLLDTYGPAPVRAVYRSGGDFQAAFGQSRAALIAAWRQALAAVEVPAGELELARERFRRGGVFERPCPHAIARRQAAAVERAQAGDRAGAVRLLRRVCRDAPDEPTYALTLAAFLVRGDAAEAAEGRAILERWSGDEAGALVRASALDALARLDGGAGDLAAARRHVATALALPLDDERRRGFEATAAALDRADLSGAFLRGYFFAPGADDLGWATAAAAVAPTDGLARYLLGLQQSEHADWGRSSASLTAALTLGLPSPRFERAAARRLAVAAWRADDRAGLTAAIERLAASSLEVDRALADDWRARAATGR